MPQLVTHNIFSKDVYDNLDNNIKHCFREDIKVYEMFSQSFDTLIYYISFNLKKARKVHKLAKYCHRNNVRDYFVNLINNIKNMDLKNDSQSLAYLFGSINHYVLDSTCHPFIFYKTGVFNHKKRKETKKYMGLHGDIETNIDAFYYINKYHKSYHRINITKEFIPKINFSENLKDIVNKTFLDTFNENNVSNYYFSAYKNSRLLYKIFINDSHGILKFLYKIFDKIVFFRTTNFEYYSTYIKQPKIQYLNIEHKKWYYPSDNKLSSNESFIDLYNKSISKSLDLITLAYKVIYDEANIEEFSNAIGNLSYIRGLDCKHSKKMTDFEF